MVDEEHQLHEKIQLELEYTACKAHKTAKELWIFAINQGKL